jgi:WbqC-like protein family
MAVHQGMNSEHIVVVHQPHFLPWPPFVAKLAVCHTFVVQDNVLYKKLYFHNRTRVLGHDGRPAWMTVPVHAHASSDIQSVQVDVNNLRLVRHLINIVRNTYCNAPEFKLIWPTFHSFLRGIGSRPELEDLVAVNVQSLLLLLESLDIPPPRIVYASQLGNSGNTRTDRIVDLIQRVKGTAYLTGWGGSANATVHDLHLLEGHGIKTLTIQKDIATAIQPEFVSLSGLSTMHWLFHMPAHVVRSAILSYDTAICEVQLK